MRRTVFVRKSNVWRMRPWQAKKVPVRVAAAASLALMGDALLYAILPSQAPLLGIPLIFVGVLLSVNRFIRLLTNAWAASMYEHHGMEKPFFLAMLLASATTFAYASGGGPAVFFPARLIWGTCWSFINLGMYLSVIRWTEQNERGRWFGTVKGISRIGTIAAVSLGGLLTDRLGFHTVMTLLGALTLAGAFLSPRASQPSGQSKQHPRTPSAKPATPPHAVPPLRSEAKKTTPRSSTALYGLGFLNGLLSNGVIMGTLSLLLVQRFSADVRLLGLTVGIATFSGFFFSIRWFIHTALAPVCGRIIDRFGPHRSLVAAAIIQSGLLVMFALTISPLVFIVAGTVLFLAEIMLTLSLDAAVGRMAAETKRPAHITSRFITAQDFGSAVGPLIGYMVGLGLGLSSLYAGAAVVSAACFLVLYRRLYRATLPSGRTDVPGQT